VRPTTHGGNGSSDLQPNGLSEGRLALVQRYMIDAEEAEVFARANAQKAAAYGREEASAAAALEGARRETAEQPPIRTDEQRRRAEPLNAGAATTKPGALEKPMRATAPVTKVAPGPNEEVASGNGRRADPRDEARARKALVKADKSAAKQAARLMAALEKKEARERKALAKAAARRKTA
jgi:hypothetical protein